MPTSSFLKAGIPVKTIKLPHMFCSRFWKQCPYASF